MEKVAKLHFVIKKEDNVYEFIAPAGAPFGETHDALYQILGEVLRMAHEAREKLEQKKAEESQEA